jgi:hypothetical protein
MWIILFGAASFYSIGLTFEPLGCGFIIDYLGGGPRVFGVGAILVLLVMYLYSIFHKMPRPDFDSIKS